MSVVQMNNSSNEQLVQTNNSSNGSYSSNEIHRNDNNFFENRNFRGISQISQSPKTSSSNFY